MSDEKKKIWTLPFIGFVIFLVIGGIYSLFNPNDDSKSSNKFDPVQERLARQNSEVKACVNTLGNGIYKDKSLSWKLDQCNAKP